MKAWSREVLTQRWRALCASMGVVGGRDLDKPFLFLYQAYDGEQRAYHNLQHLSECLHHLDSYQEHVDEVLRPSLEFALWYHDAIYDVLSTRNEEKSADSALRQLAEWGRPATQQTLVRALILATRHQTPPAGLAEAWMVDIDLGVLAAPSDRYQQYERQVRLEYRQVPWAIYRQKRGEVLEGFLKRPGIYSTPILKHEWEARARVNLAWSLEKLQGPDSL